MKLLFRDVGTVPVEFISPLSNLSPFYRERIIELLYRNAPPDMVMMWLSSLGEVPIVVIPVQYEEGKGSTRLVSLLPTCFEGLNLLREVVESSRAYPSLTVSRIVERVLGYSHSYPLWICLECGLPLLPLEPSSGYSSIIAELVDKMSLDKVKQWLKLSSSTSLMVDLSLIGKWLGQDVSTIDELELAPLYVPIIVRGVPYFAKLGMYREIPNIENPRIVELPIYFESPLQSYSQIYEEFRNQLYNLFQTWLIDYLARTFTPVIERMRTLKQKPSRVYVSTRLFSPIYEVPSHGNPILSLTMNYPIGNAIVSGEVSNLVLLYPRKMKLRELSQIFNKALLDILYFYYPKETSKIEHIVKTYRQVMPNLRLETFLPLEKYGVEVPIPIIMNPIKNEEFKLSLYLDQIINIINKILSKVGEARNKILLLKVEFNEKNRQVTLQEPEPLSYELVQI